MPQALPELFTRRIPLDDVGSHADALGDDQEDVFDLEAVWLPDTLPIGPATLTDQDIAAMEKSSEFLEAFDNTPLSQDDSPRRGEAGLRAAESQDRTGQDDAGWVGVDLDGTLAVEDGWHGIEHIGDPIPEMVERLKQWLAQGRDVRILTARVAGDDGDKARPYIEAWCQQHLGRKLPVTNSKDRYMTELWDDRAVQVKANTGQRADGLESWVPYEGKRHGKGWRDDVTDEVRYVVKKPQDRPEGQSPDGKPVVTIAAPQGESPEAPSPVAPPAQDPLFQRDGSQFERLQQAMGLKPVMGPKGAKAVRRWLEVHPAGQVMAALLDVDGSQTGYDANGFAMRGNDAFRDAIDGKFPQEQLDAANQWLLSTYSVGDLASVNQNRWIRGVVQTVRPSDGAPDVPEPSAPPAKPVGTEAIRREVATWTPERRKADWQENRTRGASFKAWFGDWEAEPETASKVVDKETGEPQETGRIPGTGSVVTGDDGEPIVVYHGTAHGEFSEFDPAKVSANNLYGPGFYFTENREVADEYQSKGRDIAPGIRWDDVDQEDLLDFVESANIRLGADIDPNTFDKHLMMGLVEQASWSSGLTNNTLALVNDWARRRNLVDDIQPETKAVYLNIRKPFAIDAEISASDRERILDAVDALNPGYKAATWDFSKSLAKRRQPTGDEIFQAASDMLKLWNHPTGSKAGVVEALRASGYDGLTHIGGDRMGGGKVRHRVWIAFEPTQVKSIDNAGTFDEAKPNLYESMRVRERTDSCFSIE